MGLAANDAFMTSRSCQFLCLWWILLDLSYCYMTKLISLGEYHLENYNINAFLAITLNLKLLVSTENHCLSMLVHQPYWVIMFKMWDGNFEVPPASKPPFIFHDQMSLILFVNLWQMKLAITWFYNNTTNEARKQPDWW